MKLVFLEAIGRAILPRKIRPHIRDYLMKTGRLEVPYGFFGLLFFITAFLTYLIFMGYIYPEFILGKNPIFAMLLSFVGWLIVHAGLIIIVMLFLYSVLNLEIYKRTKKMEAALGDYLSLVVTNLRGGMSFEKSLWSAIQPEFGILATEITMVSKKVMTGSDTADALIDFSKKYDSPVLRRAIDLIIGELKSGGRVADVIERVVENLEEIKDLKEEMAASVVTYMIFIGAIVMLIAPVLFALAFQLLTIILGFASTLGQSLGAASTISVPMDFSEGGMDPNNFKIFSVVTLAIISFFASLIVSIIEKGDIKAGLKYIPMFLITSEIFYFICLAVLGSLMGGIIPGS